MSHLHVPDGVLPAALWIPGWAAALVLLAVSARALRDSTARHVAWRGALGALALAAMAVQVPLGPVQYHLTLVGPIGVLLGAAAGYQVVFVVGAMLAFTGHGGFTTAGLNALVLGAGVAVARPVYRAVRGRSRPPTAMAAATVAGQAASGALWLACVAIGLGAHAGASAPARVGLFAGIAGPMWWVGIAVETAVAVGLAGFLDRVRPDLLPGARVARAAAPAA